MRWLSALVGLALTVLVATFLAVAVLELADGDRARAIAAARYGGEGAASGAVVDDIRAELQLDRGLVALYADWAAGVLQGNWGRSYVTGEPVLEILGRAAGLTAPMAVLAFAMGLALAVPLGTLAAIRPGGVADRLAVALGSVGAAVPSFWLGLMLIFVFSVRWRWFPAYGAGGLRHLVLPALTLAVWVTAVQTRLIRSFLREALAAPHLDALRLRGLSEGQLLRRHVARPVLVALAPLLMLELVGLLEGAVVVEVVFARPGMGLTFVEALRARDAPVILGFVTIAVLAYATANALADSLSRRLDPRLREAVHA